MTLSISERMAELKANSNTCTYSDEKGHFPLAAFLQIYSKASSECYIEYMQGARVLHNWLTSNRRLRLKDTIVDNPPKAPDLLVSYSLNELAKIVAGTTELKAWSLATNKIYHTLIHIP